MDDSDKTYYVRVRNAWHVRKAMLEASKEIIVILQRYEMFKRLRETKLQLMEDLSREFKGMQETASKMRIDMPKVEFAGQKKQEIKKAREKEGKGAFSEKHDLNEADIEDEEIKKLESAILDIEKKLSEM